MYALVTVIGLAIDSRNESADRPSALQANWAVRWASLIASIASGLVGLIGAFIIVVGGPDDDTTLLMKGLGVWTVLVAWGLLHWGFAQWYYAHYYAAASPPLQFPGSDTPDLVDFAYFAFLVGTTFANTDVTVMTRAQRWRVLVHSVMAFFFNSAILVLALSSLAGT